MATVEDDIFKNLSTVAITTVPRKVTPVKRKRKSKFFFKITPTLASQVEKRKEQFKPKVLEHVDQAITNRVKEYNTQLPASLGDNIDKVREFFLTTISPLTLAVKPAAEQASDVIRRTADSTVDAAVLLQFERMVAKGVQIKMSKFITEYLGLSESDALVLIESISPVKKEAVFLNNPLPKTQAGDWTPQGEVGSNGNGKEKT